MSVTARATNTRTGRVWDRPAPSVESAAGQLLVLMRADGWAGDEAAMRQHLLSGESTTWRRYSYEVVLSD